MMMEFTLAKFDGENDLLLDTDHIHAVVEDEMRESNEKICLLYTYVGRFCVCDHKREVKDAIRRAKDGF